MTETKPTAAEIRKRRAAEDAALRAEMGEQRAASRAAEEAARAELPHVPYEPEPVIEPGTAYVLCTEQVWAVDDGSEPGRIYLAAVPGQWLRPEYAHALGIEGDGVVLAQVATGRTATRIGGGA